MTTTPLGRQGCIAFCGKASLMSDTHLTAGFIEKVRDVNTSASELVLGKCGEKSAQLTQ
jgi:hypothetical protein